MGAGEWERTGEILYLRGLINYIMVAEAVERAQKASGKKVPSGEDVRNALESMHMTAADWERVGLPGYPEFKVTCNDHERAKGVKFQQWDASAKKWNLVSDWIPVDRATVRPMMEADAAKFAKENKITPRANCS